MLVQLEKGQFKKSVDVGRSLSADKRHKAKHDAKPGEATAATITRSTEVVMGEDRSGEIRLQFEQFVDRFVVSGGNAPDIIEMMLRELEDMKLVYEKDPDPAEDPASVEEPANDWPGSQT